MSKIDLNLGEKLYKQFIIEDENYSFHNGAVINSCECVYYNIKYNEKNKHIKIKEFFNLSDDEKLCLYHYYLMLYNNFE